jgi:hypothetical protein
MQVGVTGMSAFPCVAGLLVTMCHSLFFNPFILILFTENDKKK